MGKSLGRGLKSFKGLRALIRTSDEDKDTVNPQEKQYKSTKDEYNDKKTKLMQKREEFYKRKQEIVLNQLKIGFDPETEGAKLRVLETEIQVLEKDLDQTLIEMVKMEKGLKTEDGQDLVTVTQAYIDKKDSPEVTKEASETEKAVEPAPLPEASDVASADEIKKENEDKLLSVLKIGARKPKVAESILPAGPPVMEKEPEEENVYHPVGSEHAEYSDIEEEFLDVPEPPERVPLPPPPSEEDLPEPPPPMDVYEVEQPLAPEPPEDEPLEETPSEVQDAAEGLKEEIFKPEEPLQDIQTAPPEIKTPPEEPIPEPEKVVTTEAEKDIPIYRSEPPEAEKSEEVRRIISEKPEPEEPEEIPRIISERASEQTAKDTDDQLSSKEPPEEPISQVNTDLPFDDTDVSKDLDAIGRDIESNFSDRSESPPQPKNILEKTQDLLKEADAITSRPEKEAFMLPMDDMEDLKKQTLASAAPKDDSGTPDIVEYNQDDIRSWKQEEDAKKPTAASYAKATDIPILEPLEHKNLYDDSRIKPKGDIRKFEDGQAEVDTELSKLQDQIKELDSGEEYWKILHERGFALSRIGQYEEAIRYYEKALDLVPHNEEILSNKGVALFTLGRLDEAKVCFSLALKAKPSYEKAWNNLGVVMRSEGKPKEALRCYNMSIKANPMYKNAWYNKGFILEDMGRLEEAIRYYNKALEISPNYAEAVYSRDECLKKLTKRRLKEKQKMELAYQKEILQMDQKLRKEMEDMQRLRGDEGDVEEEAEASRPPVHRPRIRRGA